MAPKVNKGKGVASSSHGSKRARRPSEDEHENVNMAPPPLRRYGLRWSHGKDRILTLGLGFMFNAPVDCNLNMGVDVTKTKEPEGIDGPVLTVNERNARIDNMFIHLYGMQMLQLRMNGVIEEQLKQLNIDYPLSEHSRTLYSVGPGQEEPLDDDVAMEDEMTRVYSDIESSDDDEEDSEMGEAALAPTNDEE
ncbi:hypothetical protein HAX54_007967 [Datura stramonium]|uniref:Uncharacterized protein n=1 Tax=Datura stramonium TaxID=4076 RepID=A0ABS8RV72_DATST|nr:hypothetical protein [Datura stramonium]